MTQLQMFHVPVDVIEVAGPDAATYLQGQLSQNVEALGLGGSAYSLLLAPQGFVEAWFRVVRKEKDRYWLIVDSGFGESAKSRLERFKLRVDCSISLHNYILSSVRSLQPDASIDSEDLASDYQGSHAVVDTRWSSEPGFDIVGPQKVEIDGADIGTIEDFERLRISSSQPAMGRELTEKTIPAAAGIVERSVDFSKGCYVGQELVARIDSRGNNTPQRLHQVRFAEGRVSDGETIYSSSGKAGTVTSSVATSSGSLTLAYLKRDTDVSAIWAEIAGQVVHGEVV